MHIINTLISPFQKYLIQNQNIIFQNFCCACYPLIRSYNKYKLNFYSEIYLFLRYSDQNNISLSTFGKRNMLRHVVFSEQLFPFTNLLYVLNLLKLWFYKFCCYIQSCKFCCVCCFMLIQMRILLKLFKILIPRLLRPNKVFLNQIFILYLHLKLSYKF